MLRQVGLWWCASVLVAVPVMADPLVTWQADGTVIRRTDKLVFPEPGVPVAPPIGAPFSVTLTFDPSTAVVSPGAFSGSAVDCTAVNVSGSFTIAGTTSAIRPGSLGFTGAQLPGTTCGYTTTQFSLFIQPELPDDNPYKLPNGLLILSYQDLLVRDSFPTSPTPSFLADAFYYGGGGYGLDWIFDGHANLFAVDQAAAVPEPATVTLVGLGLLAARRASRRSVTPRT